MWSPGAIARFSCEKLYGRRLLFPTKRTRAPTKALLLWEKGRTDLKANFWHLPKWAIKFVFWRRVVARSTLFWWCFIMARKKYIPSRDILFWCTHKSYLSNELQIIQTYCKTMSKVIYYWKQIKGNWRAVCPLSLRSPMTSERRWRLWGIHYLK